MYYGKTVHISREAAAEWRREMERIAQAGGEAGA
jgi:hypothetical protein